MNTPIILLRTEINTPNSVKITLPRSFVLATQLIEDVTAKNLKILRFPGKVFNEQVCHGKGLGKGKCFLFNGKCSGMNCEGIATLHIPEADELLRQGVANCNNVLPPYRIDL